LTHIFNAYLKHGIYPDRLKFASGVKVIMANYRPISLLIGFSKIFESVMYNRIKQHMHTNNLISFAKFGFGETETQKWQYIP
jgi:hypothetical protein